MINRTHIASVSSIIGLCLIIAVTGLQTIANISLISVSPAVLGEIENRFGGNAKRRIERWQKLMFDLQGEAPGRQIEKVNSFFNRVNYRRDQEHWQEDDYWATPVEMLSTNGGDCEDYVIAKYFTLRALGIPDEHLRLTYVTVSGYEQAHMVLTYYGDSTSNPLVLDNLSAWIQKASDRNDLQPIYSFNGGGLWESRERGNGRLMGSSDMLDNWAHLLSRLPPDYLKFDKENIEMASAAAG